MKLDPIKQNSETATSKFFNLESDVVQLRSEIYHDNSRILTDVFGTPKEDAMRCDITINALL